MNKASSSNQRQSEEKRSRKTTEVLCSIAESVRYTVVHAAYVARAHLVSLGYLLRRTPKDRKSIFIMIGTLRGGGAQRVVVRLASTLASKYHVTLLCGGEEKGTYPINPEVEVVNIPRELWDYYRRFPQLARWIKSLKKARGAYASISFLHDMNSLNIESKANDKIICSERNNPFKSAFDAVRIDEVRSCYDRADHVVFQSERIRSLFSDVARAHSTILPNPVGVTCERKAETKRRIVNVGRLIAQKNQALLIRAFGRFHKLHPEYSLSIYGVGTGDTDLGDELRELIAALGLQNSVFLEGQSTQICEDIADAEFFVLSSDFEGLSNALLEAMMMGFPCVSTDCEGSTDVIEDGVNGLLVPRGDEDAMVKAMLTLAEQEEYREQLGKQAKVTLERFKEERVAEEWAEMIERI